MNLITTEAHGTIYHGIKRLWTSEIKNWQYNCTKEKYSMYKLPNCRSNNIDEYWIIEDNQDLNTLKAYLTKYERDQDYKKLQKIS